MMRITRTRELAGLWIGIVLLVAAAFVGPYVVRAQSGGALISAIFDAGDLSTFDTGAPEGGLLLIQGTGFSEAQDNRVRFVYTRDGQNESVEADPLFCTTLGEEDVLLLTAPTGIEPDVGSLGFAILNVSVTADGVPGANSVELRFQPAGPPQITTCSPASGGAGTLVTLEGSQLGSFGLQPTVIFESGGQPAVPTALPAITTGNRIYAIAPDGLAEGPVTIQVEIPGQSPVVCPEAFDYRIDPAPQVVTVLPRRGTAGSGVSIEGTHLSADSAPAVSFGSEPASVIAWSDVLLLAEVPVAAIPGDREVIVNAAGQTNSAGEAFYEVVSPGDPTIHSVATPAGETVVPLGHPVLIDGEFLGNVSFPPEVRINGTLASSVPLGEQRALAVVPYGLEPGPANVSVLVDRNGDSRTSVAFEAIEIEPAAPPTLVGIYPETGAPPSGEVLIVGTGFGGPESTVVVQFTRGGEDVSPAEVITHTRGTIRAVVPADAITGPVEVSVEGAVPALIESYPIVPAPEPSLDASSSDSSGARGQTIRLRGEGLWLSGQTPVVTFIGGSTSPTAEAPVRSSTGLFVVIPAEVDSGGITITVTVAGTPSNGIPFTVED